MWNRIDKKQRIQDWIDWCDIEIEIVKPQWGQHIPRGQFIPDDQKIIINGKQSDQEIIKSIIHEICHWVHNDKIDDPDIWEREDRCIKCEDQWKVVPQDIDWR